MGRSETTGLDTSAEYLRPSTALLSIGAWIWCAEVFNPRQRKVAADLVLCLLSLSLPCCKFGDTDGVDPNRIPFMLQYFAVETSYSDPATYAAAACTRCLLRLPSASFEGASGFYVMDDATSGVMRTPIHSNSPMPRFTHGSTV